MEKWGKDMENANMTNPFDLMMYISIYQCAEKQYSKCGFFKTGFSIFRLT